MEIRRKPAGRAGRNSSVHVVQRITQNIHKTHEPLAFLSRTFKGSQMCWATIDKEQFAIVSPYRRLRYFLWNGVHIFTDHRNLAYIFDPEGCVTSVSKAFAQRLEGWKGVLGQYRYIICHIPGDVNAWGHLLARWVSVPALPVRAVAVLVRMIRMIPCLPKLSFVKRNRKHLRRMARRCNR